MSRGYFRVSGIGLLMAALLASAWARADDRPPDLAQKREREQRVRQDTDHLVRRAVTMLRVLDYYGAGQRSERRVLNEVAGILAGLSKEQMAEVIARLEKAVQSADRKNAGKDVAVAYQDHRIILEQLRALLARYQAIHSLDQAAAHFEQASKQQLEIQLRTNQLTQDWLAAQPYQRQPNERARPAVQQEVRQEADEQSDLKQDVQKALAEVEHLASQLPPEQKDRLAQAKAFAQDQHLVENMTRAASEMKNQGGPPSERWYRATTLQHKSATDLQDLARILRSPSDRLAALREARERVARVLQQQENLMDNATVQKDPRVQDREHVQQQRGEARHSEKQGDEQSRLQHDTHGTRDLLQPHAPELAKTLAPAEQAMQEAERRLRQNTPDKAVEPQEEAAQTLRDVRRELDRRITAAEKEQRDPLAALQKKAEAVERLLTEQKDIQRKTAEATHDKQSQRLPHMSAKQQDLAQRTEEVKQQASPAKSEAQQALDQAADAMHDAAQKLDARQGERASDKQTKAIHALEQAKKQLDEQAAAIQKRRDDAAALEDAQKRLDDLAKEEKQIAKQAQDTDHHRSNEKQRAHELAQKQNELTPQAQALSREIENTAPEAAHKVDEGAEHMAAAKAKLDKQQSALAARHAGEAAHKLKEAAQAIAKALEQKQGEEAADEAAMRPEELDPQNAADQLGKAIEQAKQAADESARAEAPKSQPSSATTHAMARSQEATQEAQAALQQAQAQAPADLQPELQAAGKELAQAGQHLHEGQPHPANQAQHEAIAEMTKAMKTLQTAAAAMEKQGTHPGQKSSALASAQSPAQKPGQELARAAHPGQDKGTKRAPGMEQRGRSDGNRLANAVPARDMSPRLRDVVGDGAFLHLPARERELIKQAMSAALPPQYAPLIQQYYVNVARGKPAARPSAPARP